MSKLIILLSMLALAGCDVEELDCPIEDRYIDGYKEVVYPSGDIYYQAIWKCSTSYTSSDKCSSGKYEGELYAN